MKYAIAIALTLGFAGSAIADGDHGLPDEKIAMINELLTNMRCEVTGEIEVEDGEIELDDVICAGGQFDIEMNDQLHIVGARAE